MDTKKRYRHLILTATLGALVIGACAEDHEEPQTHPFSSDRQAAAVTELSRVGDGWVDFACESLCAHAAWGTYGAGVFTVDRLVEVEESSDGGETEPFVYIVLDVDDAWYPDALPTPVVARVSRMGTTGFDLEIGDRIAAFLRGDGADYNAGFPILGVNRWYTPDGEGWRIAGSGCDAATYDAPTLRSAARAATASFSPGEFTASQSCYTVDFERCPDESLIPPGWLPYNDSCPED